MKKKEEEEKQKQKLSLFGEDLQNNRKPLHTNAWELLANTDVVLRKEMDQGQKTNLTNYYLIVGEQQHAL